MLTYLATVAQGPCLKIEVLLSVISAIFDLSPSMATHLPVPLWKRCVGVALEVLGILQQHAHIVVDGAFDGSTGTPRAWQPPAASRSAAASALWTWSLCALRGGLALGLTAARPVPRPHRGAQRRRRGTCTWQHRGRGGAPGRRALQEPPGARSPAGGQPQQ